MPVLFAITLFISATLLFMVQPMVGKMILPLLGGSPAAWNTCMVFFQGLLLLGYLYAHKVTSQYTPTRQILIHLAVLIAAIVFMGAISVIAPNNSPVAIFSSLAPQGQSYPMLGVMALLSVAIGLPFLVVSTSAPLLQRWFANTGHPSAKDPYFLYAASNAGSLISLLGYPLLVEPSMTLANQAWLWAAGFVVLAGMIYVCGKATVNPLRPSSAPAPAAITTVPASVEAPTLARKLRWMALAFVPSSLMLGVTFHMTTDIASVPLLWVIPLALYLLTFIIAYARTPEWFRPVLANLSPVLTLLLVFVLISNVTVKMSTFFTLGLHLVVYFFTALLMHSELARERPHPSYLTQYFLWISLGGVIGGIFNALIAPVMLPLAYEYPIAIAIGCLLIPTVNEFGKLDPVTPVPGTEPTPESRKGLALFLDLLIPMGMVALVSGLTIAPEKTQWFPSASTWISEKVTSALNAIGVEAIVAPETIVLLLVYALPCMLCFLFIDRPVRFGLCVAAVLFVCYYRAARVDGVEDTERSFFGILRVEKYDDRPRMLFHYKPNDSDGINIARYQQSFRRLYHGTTLHGIQAAEMPVAPMEIGVYPLIDDLQMLGASSGWDALLIAGAERSYDLRQDPLTYYHRTGPVGAIVHRFRALHAEKPEKASIAMIGLGTGSIACYAMPGQKLTFYEIDPTVIKMVEPGKYFTYLKDAKARGATVDLILGDARLKLEENKDAKYDLLLVDAFSSDSIPVHLLTKQAVELYRDRLTEHGLLAIHISNRYIDLEPVVSSLAKETGLVARVWSDNGEEGYPGKTASSWVALAKTPADLGDGIMGEDSDTRYGALAGGFGWNLFNHHWKPLKEFKGLRPWTDDFSDVLAVMRMDEIRWLRRKLGQPVYGDAKKSDD